MRRVLALFGSVLVLGACYRPFTYPRVSVEHVSAPAQCPPGFIARPRMVGSVAPGTDGFDATLSVSPDATERRLLVSEDARQVTTLGCEQLPEDDGQMHPAYAAVSHAHVTLKAPLGTRPVIDSESGQPATRTH